MTPEEKVKAQLAALYDEYRPLITERENRVRQAQQELDRVYENYFTAQQEVFDENY